MERVLHADGCPLVVTGYTLEETENDEDALRDMLSSSSSSPPVEWLWEAEMNPFRSLRKRVLQFDGLAYLDAEKSFMGENCGWQCLVSSARK